MCRNGSARASSRFVVTTLCICYEGVPNCYQSRINGVVIPDEFVYAAPVTRARNIASVWSTKMKIATRFVHISATLLLFDCNASIASRTVEQRRRARSHD